MPTIPPSLPPSSGSNVGPIGPTDQGLATQFKNLWDAWWNNGNPNDMKAAQKLLTFMQTHETQIETMAGNNPTMISLKGNIPIAQALNTAIGYLGGWIQHGGGNAQGVTEFVADTYNWISYVMNQK